MDHIPSSSSPSSLRATALKSMAFFSTPSNWFFSLKLLLMSTGFLSMVMALKLSVPVVSDFIVSETPFWNVFLTWLRPPYLYILMNTIIISLVASTKLQHRPTPSADTLILALPSEMIKISDENGTGYAIYTAPEAVAFPPVQSLTPEPMKISGDVYNGVVSSGHIYDGNVPASLLEVQQPEISDVEKTPSNDKTTDSGGTILPPTSNRTSLQREDSLDIPFPDENEKPPVSARFGNRETVKASPEEQRLSEPQRRDTLESTWKAITEGRSMPLTRYLKKSDTWNSQLRRINSPLTDRNGAPSNDRKQMKKLETFSKRSKAPASPSLGSGTLRKEPSLSNEELNRRVEAFINKFNEEMRLQRQESLRKYQEMISRGAH